MATPVESAIFLTVFTSLVLLTYYSSPCDSYSWYAAGAEQQRIFWICLGCISFISPFSIWCMVGNTDAPYGRYKESSAKKENSLPLRMMAACDLPPKLAWCVMESPPLVMAAICVATARPECISSLGNCVAMLCFVIHYINRSLIYPWRMQGGQPVTVCFCFCLGILCSEWVHPMPKSHSIPGDSSWARHFLRSSALGHWFLHQSRC